MYLGIALVTAAFAAIWGWRKGLFRLVLRLSVLVLAYAFTVQETPAFAAYLTKQGWLPDALAWPAAGLVLFFVGSMVLSLLARFAVRAAPEHWQTAGKPAGALVGSVLGAGLGLLLVWGVGALQDASQLRDVAQAQTGVAVAEQTAPSAWDQADTVLRTVSGDTMATVAVQALGDGPAAAMAAEWVRQPMAMSEGLQHLASKPELRQLFENPAHYAVLTKGSVSDIQHIPAFRALVEDPQVMQLLAVAGLPGETSQQQSQSLASLLSRYAGNFEKIRATPEFQALVQDPGLRAKLQQGNLLVLLTDDKVRRLATLLTGNDKLAGNQQLEQQPAGTVAESSEAVGTAPPTVDAGGVSPEPATKALYQWKDANGRVHMTEAPPPAGIKADAVVH